MPFNELVVDLSGGHDSRMVLGLVMASKSDFSKANFFSDQSKKDDLAVAYKIADQYPINLNLKGKNPRTIESKLAYDLWKKGSICAYLPMYFPHHASPVPTLQFKGDIGVSRKNRTIDSISQNLENYFTNKEHLSLVQNEIVSSFSDIGVDSKDPFAMNLHYSHFRTRYHSGRHWFRSLRKTPVTPLICPQLRDIASMLALKTSNHYQWVCDVLLCIDPKLAQIPFDKPKKAFTAKMIDDSPFRKGRVNELKTPELLEVFHSIDLTDKKTEKASDLISNEKFFEHFQRDFADYRQKAQSLNIFSADYLEASDRELQTFTSLSHGLRRTTHIFMAGSVVDML
jgi:hypothetical protein